MPKSCEKNQNKFYEQRRKKNKIIKFTRASRNFGRERKICSSVQLISQYSPMLVDRTGSNGADSCIRWGACPKIPFIDHGRKYLSHLRIRGLKRISQFWLIANSAKFLLRSMEERNDLMRWLLFRQWIIRARPNNVVHAIFSMKTTFFFKWRVNVVNVKRNGKEKLANSFSIVQIPQM